MKSEKVICAHDCMLDDSGKLAIIRGVLEFETAQHLKIDGRYQREELPGKKQEELIQAFIDGVAVQDVEIGVRGETSDMDGSSENDDILFRAPCFIIDGVQRLAAARIAVERTPGLVIHLGARFHINSNYDYERAMAKFLNKKTKFSAGVNLRVDKKDNPAVNLIFNLSESDKEFEFYKRMTWSQNPAKTDLISPLAFIRDICALHCHFGIASTGDGELASKALLDIYEAVGATVFRENVKTFSKLFDDAWGLRTIGTISRKSKPVYLLEGFTRAIALILGRHSNFWSEKRLVIDSKLLSRLKTYNVTRQVSYDLVNGDKKGDKKLNESIRSHISRGKTGVALHRWVTREQTGMIIEEVRPDSEEFNVIKTEVKPGDPK